MKEEKKRCILPGCDVSRPVFLVEEHPGEKSGKAEERIAAVRNRFYDALEEAVITFVKDCRLDGRKIRYLADYSAEDLDGGYKIVFHLVLRENGRVKEETDLVHFWKEDVLLPRKCFLCQNSIFK